MDRSIFSPLRPWRQVFTITQVPLGSAEP